jgi:hypothetical protein
MDHWQSDGELFEAITGRLYTPVVGDILDRIENGMSSTAAFEKYGIL